MAQSSESLYEINVDRFWQRLGLLHGHWQRHLTHHKNKSQANNPYPGWHGCDSIVILCGKSDDAGYKRNNSIHIWLFGYELLSTIMIITATTVYICCGSKTSQTLRQLTSNSNNNKNNNNKLTISLLTKKKSDGYESNFSELTSILLASGGRVGLIREEMKGFAEKFVVALESNSSFSVSGFGEALSDILMLKDKFETSTMKKVSELSSLALKYFQKMMEKLIEKGKTRKHLEISGDLLRILENPRLVKSSLRSDNLDVCYDPIIQSGGSYKLKPSAECNAEELHYEYGTIVIMMGFRLRDYCSNIARTFLIDASSEQKEIYNILVTVFKKGLLMLRDGVELHAVYDKCVATIKKSKRAYLVKHFVRNVGWGIGLEFRDKHYMIKATNKRQCKAGMIFNFQVGFEGLVDAAKQAKGLSRAAKYSIIIADTVLVTDDQPEFLTKFNRKFFDYELNGDIDSSPTQHREKKKKESLDDAYLPAADEPYRRVTRQSNRKSAQEQKELMSARRERNKKQSKLRIDRDERLHQLLSESGDGVISATADEDEWRDPSVFADSSEVPQSVKQSSVFVSLAHEALICPIMDHCVPFHISCIKNFSISTNPDGTYLRINLVCPQKKNKKQPELYLAHPESHFIKELTYRSDADGQNLHYCFARLKELQKQHRNKSKNALLTASMKRQDRLQRAASSKVLILKELSLKPSLGGRKRGNGRLECHVNGFRYVDHKKNTLDIAFHNVKNAFFQKSKNTPAVIIHFHLHDAIMIGKKASFHVQVFRDVIERFEELGRRRRYEYDGMRAEQEEQKRIKRTNAQFKQFCERVEDVAKQNGFSQLKFDKPAMDLRFNGVPNKQSTNLYPTENCLVALEDSPAFVIDTADIEIAHFERVSYSLRNFDLVFVYKDFAKEPHRITTIPRGNLDTLQDFLNWKNVLYSQGKINLDWKTLMSKIRSNLSGFVASGGWDFLLPPPSDDGAAADDDDPSKPRIPDVDEYVPDDDAEDEYSSDYSDDDDDEDDQTDDDDFDESDSAAGGGGGDYGDEEDDPGLDWEELDRRAAVHDKKAAQKERNNQYRSNHKMTNSNKRRRY
eukprot:265772_1